MYTLFDHQIPNIEATKLIFKDNKYCFNFSLMGSGKSIVAAELAKDFESACVVSFANVIKHNWTPFLAKYEIKNIEIITLDKLRGQKNSSSKNKYIVRTDDPIKKTTNYTASNYWHEMCNRGTLFIIDEMQMAKNKNKGYAAITAMIEALFQYDNSRVILMSGTAIDNYVQITHYLKMLGINDNEKINNLAKSIGYELPVDKNNITEMFKNNFLPRFSSSMENIKMPSTFTGHYYYCNLLEPENRNRLAELLKSDKADLKSIKTKFKEMEGLKLKSFKRLAANQMLQNNNLKVVISLFHKKPILQLAEMMRRYNPVVIHGDTTNREELIKRLMRPIWNAE